MAENQNTSTAGAQIVESATRAAFDKPLVTNVYRSVIVEAIVDAALRPAWRWCSADYAGWDFEHASGAHLEVKQSAAKQSWTASSKGYVAPRFDIAERTGFWVGATFFPGQGRNAHIYVFAFHPRTDDAADHREPDQWVFYVLAASDLPAAKSIRLSSVAKLVDACSFGDLANAVEATRLKLGQ